MQICLGACNWRWQRWPVWRWARAMSTLPQTLPADTRVELGYQHNQLQLRAERAEGWQEPALFIDALEGAEFGKPALEVSGTTLIARVPVRLRFRGLARNVDGRGRRRAAQPMPASAGFAALALRAARAGARSLP